MLNSKYVNNILINSKYVNNILKKCMDHSIKVTDETVSTYVLHLWLMNIWIHPIQKRVNNCYLIVYILLNILNPLETEFQSPLRESEKTFLQYFLEIHYILTLYSNLTCFCHLSKSFDNYFIIYKSNFYQWLGDTYSIY